MNRGERKCLNCGKPFKYPKRFYCSFRCSDKFSKRRGHPYDEEDDADILQWVKDNAKTPEEYAELHEHFFGRREK